MATANRPGFAIEKGLGQTWETQWVVAGSGTATIGAGSPTKLSAYDTAGVGAIIPMVDGDGLLGSASSRCIFTGIAKDVSTDVAAAGICNVWVPVPGLLYRGFCKSATAMNTQAKINILMGQRVVFDLTGTTWTIDSATADALVNCVVIVGGLPNTNECLWMYSPKGTFLDTSTAITS